MTRRRIYSPFPGQPKGLEFVRGHLHFDDAKLTSRNLATGKNFFVSWDSSGGRLSVHHRNQPERALWATPRHGSSFLSAALGESTVHESHGSYALHDKVELCLTHQTVEDIRRKSSTNSQKNSVNCENFDGVSICLGRGEANPSDLYPEVDPDGTVVNGDGEVVVVSGCLYSTYKLAQLELRRYHDGEGREDGSPFHDEAGVGSDERMDGSWFAEDDGVMRVGVRYRLVFWEKRENQLGFRVELDSPVRRRDDASFFPKSMPFLESSQWSRSLLLLDLRKASRQWRYGGGGRGWSGASPVRRVTSFQSNFGTLEEDEEVSLPRLNRVLLTYASHSGERFFGFGEQFSSFNLKGRRVPIMVQEQGLGRGDQPITAAANLVAYRCKFHHRCQQFLSFPNRSKF